MIFLKVACIRIESETMLNTAKTLTQLGAIALFTIVSSHSLPANTQSRTADSFSFDELEAGGREDWNFPSENETVSIKDDIKQLENEDYDVSGREHFDIRLTRNARRRLRRGRWANKGDVPVYRLHDRIFPYYPYGRTYELY